MAPPPKPRANRDFDRSFWILTAIIVPLTLFAYQPAWNGGFIWDDDGHITKQTLRSLAGLLRIWIEPGATQQYYPVVHSAFWLQFQAWNVQPLGYHLVNIFLHAISACLFAAILRRLAIPGWWLAATLFAIHPVQVESVAWITELKNTMSGVFYFAAALMYVRFDERRTRGLYFGALALFVLALLSKSVTATLPAGLLIVIWWKRGRRTSEPRERAAGAERGVGAPRATAMGGPAGRSPPDLNGRVTCVRSSRSSSPGSQPAP